MMLFNLVHSTLIMAAPLVLASLGGLVSYHAGVLNVAMEGMILLSAFAAVTFSWMTGSAFAGVIAAMAASVLVSLFYALFVVTLKSDNFAMGITINIFISSFTLFLTRILFVGQNVFNSPEIKAIAVWKFDLGNPALNTLFANYSVLVYFMFILPFFFSFLVYKTPFGLWMRAAGQFPSALAAAGKNVVLIQYMACVICGIMCALSGAQLALSNVVMFSRDMSAGRGFICLAVILIARGNPKAAFFVAVMFGMCQALSTQLQGLGIPAQFLFMIPYVAAIGALVVMDGGKKIKRKK